MDALPTHTALKPAATGFGSVSSVAELRRLNPPDDGTAEIQNALGYWAPDDDGGGVFIWMALPANEDGPSPKDNGGTVIIPTGPRTGYWQRLYDGPISVKWFGARGDGTPHSDATDDTCIQAAIDAASANGGGKVLIPSGRYVIAASISIRPNVQIVREPFAVSERIASPARTAD